jgi:uncharacterized surface protein with fasciclin (FAS1) repeats
MTKARVLTLIGFASLALAGPAIADSQADVLCRPIQGEWESVAGGTEISAIDREIAKIPPLCATLKAEAQRRRTTVARQLNQSRQASAQAAHETSARNAATERDQAVAADNAAYAIAKATDSATAYQAYLSAYPTGRHSSEALAALAAARGSEEAKARLAQNPQASGSSETVQAPPGQASDLYEAAKSSGRFTILVRALDETNLTGILRKNPNLTLFAPTDDAFRALPADLFAQLTARDNASANRLQQILIYHLINARVPVDKIAGAKGPVVTVEGRPLTIDGSDPANLRVNTADVIQPAVVTANGGVLYPIDKVLIPADSPDAGQ